MQKVSEFIGMVMLLVIEFIEGDDDVVPLPATHEISTPPPPLPPVASVAFA